MCTEKQRAQRNSGHKGAVGTEEQWGQRNSGHRGTVGTGTVGTEEQWAQRNSGHRGIVGTEGTEEQWAWRNSRKIRKRETVGAGEWQQYVDNPFRLVVVIIDCFFNSGSEKPNKRNTN